ncbi:hypothetical protein CHEID_09755 [Corynebacterium heidelbergense]|nr:hypothetical protein CHEID_09755 [Corynebacterium heidelbergense]
MAGNLWAMGRKDKASGPAGAALIVDVEDPGLAQEAQLVAVVTGRRVCSPEEVVTAAGVTVLTDREEQRWERAARVIRVDQWDPPLAAGGAVSLAEYLVAADVPRVAVFSACGGAGGSVFTLALAGCLSAQSQEALVVDADPLSVGLDLLAGVEQDPGWRLRDIGADAGEEVIDQMPWVGGNDYDVAIASNRGGTVADIRRTLPVLLRQRVPIVVDFGRVRVREGAWQEEVLRMVQPDAVLLVAPLSVAGLDAARTALDHLSAVAAVPACGRGQVVLRRLAGTRRRKYRRGGGAEVDVPMAAMMLDQAPVGVIDHDEYVQAALDAGDFDLTSGALGSAAVEALGEVLGDSLEVRV